MQPVSPQRAGLVAARRRNSIVASVVLDLADATGHAFLPIRGRRLPASKVAAPPIFLQHPLQMLLIFLSTLNPLNFPCGWRRRPALPVLELRCRRYDLPTRRDCPLFQPL